MGGGCFRLPVTNIIFRKHPSRGFYVDLSRFFRFSACHPLQKEGLRSAFFIALFTLSEYLYNEYKGYTNIEREALKMSESRWIISKWLRQGEAIGEENSRKETAYEMFLDSKNINEIRKYSKLSDEKLAEVLADLSAEIQSKYSILTN